MFTVRWAPSALSDLAEFWTNADSRARRRITDTVREIDRILERGASTAGESREPGFRIFLEAPIGVEFFLRESDRLAYVFRIWLYSTPD